MFMLFTVTQGMTIQCINVFLIFSIGQVQKVDEVAVIVLAGDANAHQSE